MEQAGENNSIHTHMIYAKKCQNTEKAEGYEKRDNRDLKGEHCGEIVSELHLHIFLTNFKYCIYLVCASH